MLVVAPVPKSKKVKKAVLMVLGIILTAFALLMALVLIPDHFKALSEGSELTYQQIDTRSNLHLTDVLVCDTYANETDADTNLVNCYYAAVIFWDVDENPCIASLAVHYNDEAFNTIQDYLRDDNLQIGDCWLDDVYCSVSELYSGDDQAKYYDEYLDSFTDIMGGSYVISTTLDLDYIAGTQTGYETALHDSTDYIFIGVLLLIGVAMILCSVLCFRPQKVEVPDTSPYPESSPYPEGSPYVDTSRSVPPTAPEAQQGAPQYYNQSDKF